MRMAMASREASSGSVGCQRMPGKAAAKKHTCCPVPEAISSTLPLAGSTASSTVRMGSLLRSAAAEVSSSLAIGTHCAFAADAGHRHSNEEADDRQQHTHQHRQPPMETP